MCISFANSESRFTATDCQEYDQANDMFIKTSERGERQLYSKLKFSCMVVFPELSILLGKVHEAAERMWKDIGVAKSHFKQTGKKDKFYEIEWRKFGQEMDRFDAEIDGEFQRLIKIRDLL